MDQVKIGKFISDERKAKGYTQKQLSELLGISDKTISKWECGKCYPQADNLVALAILYNVSPMELLVEEDRVSSSSCLWGNLFVV